jgi:serine/threonine-protein kinase RsbW
MVTEQVTAGPDQPVLDLVHDGLDRVWSRLRPPADETFRLLFTTAVAEVAANVMKYADPRDGRTFRMELELTAHPASVEARFSDDGHPFTRQIEDAQGLGTEDLAERGRGLQIAVDVLDQLSYYRVNGRNRWRLVKRRDGAPEMLASGK